MRFSHTSLKAESQQDKSFAGSVTVSRDVFQVKDKIEISSFQFLDMVGIDAETNLKTFSAKDSVRHLFKAKSWREDLEI